MEVGFRNPFLIGEWETTRILLSLGFWGKNSTMSHDKNIDTFGQKIVSEILNM